MVNKVVFNKINTTMSNQGVIPLGTVWNMSQDYSTRVQGGWSIQLLLPMPYAESCPQQCSHSHFLIAPMSTIQVPFVSRERAQIEKEDPDTQGQGLVTGQQLFTEAVGELRQAKGTWARHQQHLLNPYAFTYEFLQGTYLEMLPLNCVIAASLTVLDSAKLLLKVVMPKDNSAKKYEKFQWLVLFTNIYHYENIKFLANLLL